MERDYSSISPSAKALLLTKGLTTIPYAQQAASLMFGEESLEQVAQRVDEETFLLRLIHFENRYWCVTTLMNELGGSNIIELSSGFSFRGLNKCAEHLDIVYIDTDLPGVIAAKQELVDALTGNLHIELKGKLTLQALNVLDEAAFNNTCHLFPPGALTIANEGLLVYLDENEKRQLCDIIHHVLKQRGGCWITGDIYINADMGIRETADEFSRFLKEHHVDDNKFKSFEEAETFFNSCGFEVIKKLQSVPEKLTTARFLKPETIARFAERGPRARIHETWALKPF